MDKAKNTKRIAVYPGTFDPFTNGHLRILRRAVNLFDEVIVAVSDHGRKNTRFDIEERCSVIRECVADCPKPVHVEPFYNLVTDYAESKGAVAIIRGLRVTSDFEYEFKMSQFMAEQNKNMEIIYLMASSSTLHISSSSVKEIANLKGDVSRYVPPQVLKMVKESYGYGRGGDGNS